MIWDMIYALHQFLHRLFPLLLNPPKRDSKKETPDASTI